MSKKTSILIIIILVLVLAGGGYWIYNNYFGSGVINTRTTTTTTTSGGNIFTPLNGTTRTQNTLPLRNTTNNTGQNAQNSSSTTVAIPTIRELSTTPVGGMVASTSGTSTLVRWVNRGTGYVYEARSNSLDTTLLSNTTVPMIYQSFWNRNGTAFVFQSLDDTGTKITNFYVALSKSPTQATTTATSSISKNTPYVLKGDVLPANTTVLALSPLADKIFRLADGSGYISQFDGTKTIKLFSTPLKDINVEWPTDSTLAITTKGNSALAGFLYFVNTKTGQFTKVLGGINGLATLTNKDATKILYTRSVGQTLSSSIFDVKTGTDQELAFNTMPEKCVWSSIKKDNLICAVPSTIPTAQYPEDWYQGNTAFTDSIWEVNITTGEAHQIATMLNFPGELLDATNLTLDPKENVLYFINKRDLTLWSVNLNS